MRLEKTILPDHLEKFFALLREIELVLPLDWENIKKLLRVGNAWPKPYKSAVGLAVSTITKRWCLPFQPCFSISSPPNHVAKKVGVLEFKLIDTTRSRLGGNIYYPISISVFPSGYRILKLYGLELHSNGQAGGYEPRSLRTDQRLFRDRPLIYGLVRHLIASFPLAEEDATSRELKTRALVDLDTGGSVDETFAPSQN